MSEEKDKKIPTPSPIQGADMEITHRLQALKNKMFGLYAAKGELVDKIERMQYQLNQVNMRINQVLTAEQPKNEPKARPETVPNDHATV